MRPGFYRDWALAAVLLSVLVLAVAGCGSSPNGDGQTPIVAGPPVSADFLAAESACGSTAVEPAVEWAPTVPCADQRFFCCIAPDRGSEYDLAANTIRLADGTECRDAMLTVNLPCEYQNAVSWQNGETIDRCIQPC